MTPSTSEIDAAFAPFRDKMRAVGLPDAAIRAFASGYAALRRGATGLIPEAEIEPARGLPQAADLAPSSHPDLLAQTVVIKLNGGLGTSMGLEKAKSLLPKTAGTRSSTSSPASSCACAPAPAAPRRISC
jgi:UTP--glucose-1-phosphate uridylyltransferase